MGQIICICEVINNKILRMQKKQESVEYDCLQNYSSLIDNSLCSLIINQPFHATNGDNQTQQFMGRTYTQSNSSTLKNKLDFNVKNNNIGQKKHVHQNSGCSHYEAIDGVQPWTQKNFQITEYHKKQHIENMGKKARNNRKISCVGLKETKSKDCTQFQDSRAITLSGKWQQKQKQCNHRICSSRKEKQSKSQSNFNTISTSAQQKIKWQLQMQIMMRRRKKVSNMLKIRHFGHLKINTQSYKPVNNSNQSSCKKPDWINSLQLENLEENVGQNLQKYEEVSPKNYQVRQKNSACSIYKKQVAKIQVQNLYSALKSFMHRNQVKRRMSQTKTYRPRGVSASSSNSNSNSYNLSYNGNFTKKAAIQYKTIPRSQAQIKISNDNKIGYLNQTSEDLKNKFSQILSNRQSKLNRNNDHHVVYNSIQQQKIHSRSQNLTKQNYAGHSIKNRLKLLKSRTKTQRNSSQIPKSGRQKVQEISSLTKVNTPKMKI